MFIPALLFTILALPGKVFQKSHRFHGFSKLTTCENPCDPRQKQKISLRGGEKE